MQRSFWVMAMLAQLFVISAQASTGILRAGTGPKSEPRTAPNLSIEKFAGTWYEIASIPQFFQKGCVATSATYTPQADGEIAVLNQCRDQTLDGKLRSIHGKAWASDRSSPAKLRVQFYWPISASYWILDVGQDYEYAVTGSPSRKYLWILSRERHMDPAVYDKLVAQAQAQGFDVSQLKKTLQPADLFDEGEESRSR